MAKKHYQLTMDMEWKTEEKPAYRPKVYTGVICEQYIKERNQNWLNDNPVCSEETKQQIINENRV